MLAKSRLQKVSSTAIANRIKLQNMETIKIDWENCFGIGKLNHEFNFNTQNSNSFMIYAPNGTMKTSFAKHLI